MDDAVSSAATIAPTRLSAARSSIRTTRSRITSRSCERDREAVASTTDGFALSQLDLEARREGDVLGTSQSGRRSSLRMLRVVSDADLIADARVAATAVVDEDPELAAHPALKSALADLLDEERAGYLEKA